MHSAYLATTDCFSFIVHWFKHGYEDWTLQKQRSSTAFTIEIVV